MSRANIREERTLECLRYLLENLEQSCIGLHTHNRSYFDCFFNTAPELLIHYLRKSNQIELAGQLCLLYVTAN